MKRLILMRHAKSDWSAGAGTDFDRPLNDRGRLDAPRMGAWLQHHGYLPDQVLCSSAARTRETLFLTDIDAETEFMPSLYHAPATRMMEILRYDAAGDTVMIIGHNPGIAALAHDILEQAPTDEKFRQYPTASILVARFEIAEWTDANWFSAKHEEFVYPKLLDEFRQ